MRRVVRAGYVSVDGVVDNPTGTQPFWNHEIAKVQKEQLFRSQNGGDILLYGSAMIALVKHDLIDEIRLMVHPVIVGRGKRLLADGITTKTLPLVDTTPIGSGIVMLRYEPVR